MNYQIGFLGDTINMTFLACEVSLLVSYLVVTSIYQVSISGLLNSNPDLKNRVSIINAKHKLKLLRLASVATGCTILVSTISAIAKNYIMDCISLCSFFIVTSSFLYFIIATINNLMED